MAKDWQQHAGPKRPLILNMKLRCRVLLCNLLAGSWCMDSTYWRPGEKKFCSGAAFR